MNNLAGEDAIKQFCIDYTEILKNPTEEGVVEFFRYNSLLLRASGLFIHPKLLEETPLQRLHLISSTYILFSRLVNRNP